MNYLDKILYLYPSIQHVMYWHSQYDGQPWNDPYDGIVWNNKDIPKPSKAELDALDESLVQAAMDAKALENKLNRLKADESIQASYLIYKENHPDASFADFVAAFEKLAMA